MSQVFKPLYEDTTHAKQFGICDDKEHQRAYINEGHGGNWSAVIDNKSQRIVTFTAFDNCIEFRNPDNKMESRCEGALTYDDTIIFLEIKERKGDTGTWVKKAEEQLRATISTLSSKIDLNSFKNKKAAITNKLKPCINKKHTERIKKFKDDTGYLLTINNRIIIE